MKKVLNIFIIVVLLVFVSACGNKNKVLTEIEKAFSNNASLDKYKMEITIEGKENDPNNIINEKYTSYINFKEKTALFIDNISQHQYYLMKDCIIDNNHVEYLPWDEFISNNFLARVNNSSYNFKLDRLVIDSSLENGVTEYIITFPDDNVNDFIKENFVDDEYQTAKYTNYVIKIKVDSNGFWTNLNFSFDYLYETTNETTSGHTSISYNILAIGNEADFTIPKEIKEYIYSFYDQHTYDGPRSYQYERNIDLETPNLPYENTDVITYHNNISTISYFDKLTKSMIVTGWQSISVYDANTAKKGYDLSLLSSKYAYGNGLIAEIKDLWNGHMPNRYRITTYDFKTRSTINSIELSGEDLYFSSPYNVYGNTLMMDTGVNNETRTAFINTTNGTMYYSEENLGTTKRLVNNEHNILYCENSSTTYYNGESILQFVNIDTGKVIKTIKVTGITSGYNNSGLAIIGNSLFFYNKIYDLVTGEIISDSPLIKNYSALGGFTPIKTIYSDDKYDIISGYCEKGYEVAIYDNVINKYVFRAVGEFNSAEYVDGIFFIFNYKGFATIDTNKITGELESNMGSEIKVTEDADRKITKLNFPGNYTDLVVDGDYLFVALGKTVKVFELNTYNLNKEINFNQDVYSLDANGNSLAVSFGKKYRTFALIDINNWEIKHVTTENGVTDIQVYNNCVYFTGQSYWDHISYYDITTQKISRVNAGEYSQPYFTINKNEGILYIGETGSSSSDYIYIDLKTNNTIYKSSFNLFSYNNFPILYDGTYVHYYGFIFDSVTGERLFKDDYEKMFPSLEGYEFLGVIYNDGNTSVVVAQKNGQKLTMIYDLITGTITETIGDAERVIRYKNQFIIVRPNRDVLFIVK